VRGPPNDLDAREGGGQAMRQDILTALHRRAPQRVPWTIHHELLQRGSLERRLRNQGLAIVEKGVRPYREGNRSVSIEERQGWEGSTRLILRTWHTPHGELHSRVREGPDGSLWTEEYPLRRASDFRLLAYITEDTEYRTNDAAVAAAQRALGEDGLVLCRMMRSPLQRLLTEWMGTVGVSYALADDRTALDRLVNRMAAKDEEAMSIASRSPAEAVWSAENVTGDIVGPEIFRRYHAPYYEQAVEILRPRGKLYGVHMDGRLRSLKELIGSTAMDFIEGFTPPPLGDLSLEQARTAWPEKAIWANIPGNLFLGDDREVIRALRDLLRQGTAAGGFLLTLTEEFPDPERSLLLLAEAVASCETDGNLDNAEKPGL
jgi:hypothetical protein